MRIIQSNEIDTKDKLHLALPLVALDDLDISILSRAVYNYLQSSYNLFEKEERAIEILAKFDELIK